jgi:hypothetical protein
VATVEELLWEARRLDLSSIEGRFRLGEIAEALRRELPAVADLHDRLAIDLEVDRDTLTEAWFVAAAFPPATRRPGLPWNCYLLLRFHPERHELVDRAAQRDGIRPASSGNWRLALPPITTARRTSPRRAGRLAGAFERGCHSPGQRCLLSAVADRLTTKRVRCRRWSWACPVGSTSAADSRGIAVSPRIALHANT